MFFLSPPLAFLSLGISLIPHSGGCGKCLSKCVCSSDWFMSTTLQHLRTLPTIWFVCKSTWMPPVCLCDVIIHFFPPLHHLFLVWQRLSVFLGIFLFVCFSVPLSSLIYLLSWPSPSCNDLGRTLKRRRTHSWGFPWRLAPPAESVAGWRGSAWLWACVCAWSECLTSSVADSDFIPFSLLHVHEHRKNTFLPSFLLLCPFSFSLDVMPVSTLSL